MRHLIATSLVLAMLSGIAGLAFADPGEFGAPAQEVKASTDGGTVLGVRDVLAIDTEKMGSEIENKHNLER